MDDGQELFLGISEYMNQENVKTLEVYRDIFNVEEGMCTKCCAVLRVQVRPHDNEILLALNSLLTSHVVSSRNFLDYQQV